MTKLLIFGQKIKIEDLTHLLGLLVQLNENRTEFWIFKEYLDELPEDLQNKYKDKTWATYEDIIRIRPGCLLSLGGDGTILQAVTLVRDSKVPILGINMGRLGFLASIEKKLIPDAIYQLVNGSYEVEERS